MNMRSDPEYLEAHSEYMRSLFLERPTSAQARAMARQLTLEPRTFTDDRLDSVLRRIRETHLNGGALFASFTVGPNQTFDYFASKGLLLQFGILRLLMDRAEVKQALPDLNVEPVKPDNPALVVNRVGDLSESRETLDVFGFDLSDFEHGEAEYDGNFRVTSSFLFDGELAQKLYHGGAYTRGKGDGRSEKESALGFCEALFDLRISEVFYFSSHNAWTPWFANLSEGLDWTAVLYDPRLRSFLFSRSQTLIDRDQD